MPVFNDFGRPPQRRPSLRGTLCFDLFRGVERARAWRGKQPSNRSAAAKERQDFFRQANMAAKWWSPFLQVQILEAIDGTPFLPRDLPVMIAYGRFASLTLDDGRQIFSMAQRNDISQSLDILAQLPGSMLYRGTDYWEGLNIGAPGQHLQISPSGLIEWADPPARDPLIPIATTAILIRTPRMVLNNVDYTVDPSSGEIIVNEGGAWSASAPNIVTVPIGATRMRVEATIAWNTNSSGVRQVGFHLGGVLNCVTQQAAGGFTGSTGAWTIDVVAGQQWSCVVAQNSGINLQFSPSGSFASSIRYDFWA